MNSTTLHVTATDAVLEGTLLTPVAGDSGEHRPLAVLISGSGPLDRNSNMKRMSIDVMRQVAEHLADAGIASFRYDKRGVGASSGDFHAAGLHDNVADAAAVIEALRSEAATAGSPLVVVGHSEGALIAGELAAADSSLAGVVLLAGTATPGEDLLRWQAKNVAATLPKPVSWLLRLLRQDIVKTQTKRLEQIRSSTQDTMCIQLAKVNAKWLREFMAHDPAPALRQLDVPLLALTGSKDIQVNPDDVATITNLAGPRSSGQVVEDVTHLLRSDDGSATMRTYKAQAKRPVDQRILQAISEWITQVTANIDVENAT